MILVSQTRFVTPAVMFHCWNDKAFHGPRRLTSSGSVQNLSHFGLS
jgi:hypothetical protein